MKKSTVIDPRIAAADAVAHLLPSPAALEAIAIDGAPSGSLVDAVMASFVGENSVDFAIVFTDPVPVVEAMGTDSPSVSLTDLLRPALDAAAGIFGSGVLGDARLGDATAFFADDATEVFALSTGGISSGWFGVRVRETLAGAAPISEESLASNLGRISNVEMALTVEIGRTRMSVRDVLGLEPGAVVELDRSAGSPADILLNGRLIAHGEIVVVDQDYAVRITQILDVTDGIS